MKYCKLDKIEILFPFFSVVDLLEVLSDRTQRFSGC